MRRVKIYRNHRQQKVVIHNKLVDRKERAKERVPDGKQKQIGIHPAGMEINGKETIVRIPARGMATGKLVDANDRELISVF